MDIADRIREQGFRRWYERRLNEAHLSLVTCLLCMVTAASCLEAFGDQPGFVANALLLAGSVGATLAAIAAWRRFQSALTGAEALAGQATCRNCDTYAKWEIVSSGSLRDEGGSPWLDVRCRKCGSMWHIE